MDSEPLKDMYKTNEINLSDPTIQISLGKITEKDKFQAAKQILLGLAILYILTLGAYLVRPLESQKLLDVITTTFPPLATLILVAYFRSGS